MDSGPLRQPAPMGEVIASLYDDAFHDRWEGSLETICTAMGWEGAALHACGDADSGASSEIGCLSPALYAECDSCAD